MGQAAQPISSGFFLLPESLFAKAISIPNTKKPPGANTNIVIGGMDSGSTWKPKSLPAPRSSLTPPIIMSAQVKPMPIPRPSAAERITLFLPANASALPRIMQLTTISGKYTPSISLSAGKYALTSICTIVTKPAITTM